MAKRRIVGAFDIGDPAQGEFMVAEWVPDPSELEANILQMADDFDDWDTPMYEAQQVIIEDTRIHFQREREPIGAPWIPLEDDYAKWKEKRYPGQKILSLTGDLEEAATSEDAWIVAEDSITFNVDALPTDDEGNNYGAILQAGSGKGITTFHRLARSHTGMQFVPGQGNIHTFFGRPATDAESKFYENFSGHQETGPGRNLPARPFIGMSEQAIVQVESIFLRHMKRTIEDEWDEPLPEINLGAGGMASNILGTFPVISYTRHGVPIIRTPHGPRFGRK